ncbi:MAG: terpene cyclase/mutase family protein [Planctomycetota bacterium]|nr:prenyltransferase [Planctomycetota bacterium]MDP6518449.1 terpene cyclase/mutase family protein [Planctomycetota bacterium]MDP6838350.1 terpene cyclase/mutase family protein [Planctomycetota bacterium]
MRLPLALCLSALLALPAAGRSSLSSPLPSATPQPLEDNASVQVTAEQAAAVKRGLAWLANHQSPSGGWASKIGFKLNNDYRYTVANRDHVGVTALAGMAFLAGGHLPGRGEYGAEVERALDYVLGCVQEDGYITNSGTRMYSHAFATLFLAEIYGMTHREDVRLKLQRAVDFIVKSQNTEGGWRYAPLAAESDMSIVVCQVLALRAARNIGIRVPRSCVDRAARYVVDSSVTGKPSMGLRRASEVGTFHYQKDSHSRTSFALTSAGVTALNGLGIYSDELISLGVDYLTRNLDSFNARHKRSGHYFFWYGHYYGVQAMYTQGGNAWRHYFTQLRETLLEMQEPEGSWPNQVGPGTAYGTATAVLILEIPFGFLPIFQR